MAAAHLPSWIWALRPAGQGTDHGPGRGLGTKSHPEPSDPNFTGSAGNAVILQDKAVIFVDGRYTFQVYQQVDSQNFKIEHFHNYWNWLNKNVKVNIVIGIDPSLITNSEINKFEAIVKQKNSF